MVSDASRKGRATVARYEALIQVSEALRAYHDRDELVRSLARELRPVIHFDFLGLALYDESSGRIIPFVLEATGEAGETPVLTSDDQLTDWVIRTQQPLVVASIAEELRFIEEMEYLRRQNTQSICCLPLETPQRRVGMLLAASRQPHTYDPQDVAFLTLVANQVALAIDDTYNYGALQAALQREQERIHSLEASDELLRTLSTVLDIRAVFGKISKVAATVLPHDKLTLTLHDNRNRSLLSAASDDNTVSPTFLQANDGTAQEDTAFTLPDIRTDGRLRAEPDDCLEQLQNAGYRSVIAVQIPAADGWLSLHFWSKRIGAYNQTQYPVARRIADHVALALSHQRLLEVTRRASVSRDRASVLERRVTALAAEVNALGGQRRVIGESKAWKTIIKQATQVAGTDTTVLLVGESGTGKEVVARLVHRTSLRSEGPFIALNCAALPEPLLESELFGYERGAFTGATHAKPGHLEQASGGTLFLDEVAEMSAPAQAKLLRVLQEREFQRLGGTRPMKADVRVIAATNRDLRMKIEDGTFREDLYYRLQVFEIRLPPLRERQEDILPLSQAFLEEITRNVGRPPAGIAVDAMNTLVQYDWPGNVRELRNALERAAILCEGGLITSEHLVLAPHPTIAISPGGTDVSTAFAPTTTVHLRSIEKAAIERALQDARFNKSLAAKNLGLSRKQLYVRLKHHGLF
ncbi:MAG: sigma 54-interacting transcriptional regulator [Gammaproteobacteria bacterium]|nr:sigma 54-interacting transcriptional regulator [Gammaproteobacteria bacterium]